MAKRERIQKPAPAKQEEVAEELPAADTEEAQALLDDNILDEIDELLEENAQDFVENYVQKGGQAVIGEGANLGTPKNIPKRCREILLVHTRGLRNAMLGLHGRVITQRLRPVLV